jgi:hypothetical protein
MIKKINGLCGIKESDTGLSLPSLWNLEGDRVLLSEHVIFKFIASLSSSMYKNY